MDGRPFLVFSGNETQSDLVVSTYNEDWSQADPFQQTILASEYDEERASTGAEWIPEHSLWAIAYTNMFAEGGDMDGRARLLCSMKTTTLSPYDSHNNKIALHFVHTYLARRSPHLSYDAGPVIIERWRIEPI